MKSQILLSHRWRWEESPLTRDEAPGSRLVSLLRNEGGGLPSLTVGAAAEGVGRHRVPARG